MSFYKFGASVFTLFIVAGLIAEPRAGKATANPQNTSGQIKASLIPFITPEELKAKVVGNQAVTIIDVRSSSTAAESGSKIKGAIYVKLRRLRYRLGFPPLKDVPRNSEVVTYCACPSDEASVRAAQLLQDAGFKRVRALKGGWNGWLKAKGPIEGMPRG
jgi:rhodanese-related sulfurtransferase